MAGAPLGNMNRTRGAEVSHAVRRALAQDNWARLRAGAEKLAQAFADGQPWAFNLVWERMEGRVPQALILQDDAPRELDLATLVQLVIASRTASATDALPIEHVPESDAAQQPDASDSHLKQSK
jgi:hypothetical protein